MRSPYVNDDSGRDDVLVPLVLLVVAALLAFAYAFSLGFGAGGLEQGASSVQRAVYAAANQCQAVEGAYPSGLGYLEEHYGLRVNERDYDVRYEVFADNVPPTVDVRPR